MTCWLFSEMPFLKVYKVLIRNYTKKLPIISCVYIAHRVYPLRHESGVVAHPCKIRHKYVIVLGMVHKNVNKPSVNIKTGDSQVKLNVTSFSNANRHIFLKCVFYIPLQRTGI